MTIDSPIVSRISPIIALNSPHIAASSASTDMRGNLFQATQTLKEEFYWVAVEAGLIDLQGNCFIDETRFRLPYLSEEGIRRLDVRLDRTTGTIRKNIHKFSEWKLVRLREAYESIVIYCRENGLNNPITVDFEAKIATVSGLKFCVRGLLAYLLTHEVNRSIKSIEINGGDLISILGKEFDSEAVGSLDCVNLIRSLEKVQDENAYQKAQDLDIKINAPLADWNDLENLVNLLIEYLSLKLFGLVPEEIKSKTALVIKELIFSKLKHVPEKPVKSDDNFYIASIEDTQGMKVDLNFVASQSHKQLFHANGLALDITAIIMGTDPKAAGLVPYGEIRGGWQSIFDRLSGILGVSRLDVPFKKGWSRLISAYVKGYRSSNPDVEAHLLSDLLRCSTEIVVEELNTTVADHNRGRIEALFSALFMASCFLSKQKNSEAFIRAVWLECKKRIDSDFPDGILDPFCSRALQLIWSGKVTWIQFKSIIEVICCHRMALLPPSIGGVRMVDNHGIYSVQYAFCEDINFIFPCDLENSLKNFNELLLEKGAQEICDLLPMDYHFGPFLPESLSVLCLYPKDQELVSQYCLRLMDSWIDSPQQLLNQLFLPFHITLKDPTEERLGYFCGLIGQFILKWDTPLKALPYVDLIEARYGLCKEARVFKRFSATGDFKSYLEDLADSKIPVMYQACFDLWNALEENNFKESLAFVLIDATNETSPATALKIIERLLSRSDRQDDTIRQCYLSLEKICAKRGIREIKGHAYRLIARLCQISRPTPNFSRKRPAAYLNQNLFIGTILFLLEEREFQVARETLSYAIEKPLVRKTAEILHLWVEIGKKILSDQNMEISAVITFFGEMDRTLPLDIKNKPVYQELLLHFVNRCFGLGAYHQGAVFLRKIQRALLDQENLERYCELHRQKGRWNICENDAAVLNDIFKEEPAAFSQRQMFELTTEWIRLSVGRHRLIPAKEECLKLMDFTEACSESFRSIVVDLLEKFFHEGNCPYLLQLLKHPNSSLLLGETYWKESIAKLLKLSASNFSSHSTVLRFATQQKALLEQTLSYLIAQLCAIPGSSLQEGGEWDLLKRQLKVSQSLLFEHSAKNANYSEILQLAFGFYLWGIEIEPPTGTLIIEALLACEQDTPLDVIHHLLKISLSAPNDISFFHYEPYRSFMERFIVNLFDEGKYKAAYFFLELFTPIAIGPECDERNGKRLIDLLRLLAEKQFEQPILSIIRTLFDQKHLKKELSELILHLGNLCLSNGDPLLAVSLLSLVKFENTEIWTRSQLAVLGNIERCSPEIIKDFVFTHPDCLDCIQDKTERIFYLSSLYCKGMEILYRHQMIDIKAVILFINLREKLLSELNYRIVPQNFLKPDLRLVEVCAATGSLTVAIISSAIIDHLIFFVTSQIDDYVEEQKVRLLTSESSADKGEAILLNTYGGDLTRIMHRSFVSYLLFCFKLMVDERDPNLPILEVAAYKILKYATVYCRNNKHLLYEICLGFPQVCSSNILYYLRIIFCHLIEEDQPGFQPRKNEPILVNLVHAILDRIIHHSHDIVLSNSKMDLFFDKETLASFWSDYFITAFEYVDPEDRAEDSIYVLVTFFENLHRLKPYPRLLNPVLDKFYLFIAVLVLHQLRNLTYPNVTNNLVKILFKDRFPSDTPEIVINSILSMPKKKIFYTPGGKKPVEVDFHLKNKAIQNVANQYFEIQYQFCMTLMDTLKIKQAVDRINIRTRASETEDLVTYIEEKSIAMTSESYTTSLKHSETFGMETIEYLSTIICNLIKGHPHQIPRLVDLVTSFVYMDLISDCETLFQFHLIESMKILREAFKSAIFVNNNREFCRCYAYAGYYVVNFGHFSPNQREIISDALCDVLRSSNPYKLHHGMRILAVLSEQVYFNCYKEFYDLFNILMVSIKGRHYEMVHYADKDSIVNLSELSQVIGDQLPFAIQNSVGIDIDVLQQPLFKRIGSTLFELTAGKYFVTPDDYYPVIKCYLNYLFEFLDSPFPEGLDFEENHVLPFLCECISRYPIIALSDDLHEQLDRAVYEYLKDPRLKNRDQIMNFYEKLLFNNPSIVRVHRLIMECLQSGWSEGKLRAKLLFERALRQKIYQQNHDLSMQVIAALR